MQISDGRERCPVQKTRVTALSCGMKISTVHCFVLSQSMHVTGRQIDGRTDRMTTANTVPAYCLHATDQYKIRLASSSYKTALEG